MPAKWSTVTIPACQDRPAHAEAARDAGLIMTIWVRAIQLQSEAWQVVPGDAVAGTLELLVEQV